VSEWEVTRDELVERLMAGMPESWDDDAAAESICVDYVREIERRLLALGGSLERCPEDGAP
jgi:hypothetical protein